MLKIEVYRMDDAGERPEPVRYDGPLGKPLDQWERNCDYEWRGTNPFRHPREESGFCGLFDNRFEYITERRIAKDPDGLNDPSPTWAKQLKALEDRVRMLELRWEASHG